jgi:hypothetical protein
MKLNNVIRHECAGATYWARDDGSWVNLVQTRG